MTRSRASTNGTELEEAMKTYGLKNELILTLDSKTLVDADSGRIAVMPVWEWLLSGSR